MRGVAAAMLAAEPPTTTNAHHDDNKRSRSCAHATFTAAARRSESSRCLRLSQALPPKPSALTLCDCTSFVRASDISNTVSLLCPLAPFFLPSAVDNSTASVVLPAIESCSTGVALLLFIAGWMDGVDGWMDGWMDGWLVRCVDVWVRWVGWMIGAV